MLRDDFIKSVAVIEKVLYESKTLEFAKNNGVDKESLSMLCAEIFKQAIQGAMALEELEQKAKASSLELDKARIELELNSLNAKVQNKQLEAEALKSFIQAKSMIRSVSDNATIQQANSYVGFLNVVGNATEQDAIKSHATNVIQTISQIDVSKIDDFDDILKKLLNQDDDIGSKSVIIHAPKAVVCLGEYLEVKGISIYGENASRFLLDNVIVATNTKNYIFEAKEEGEYKISFEVDKDENTTLSDSLNVKVIKGDLNTEKLFFPKNQTTPLLTK